MTKALPVVSFLSLLIVVAIGCGGGSSSQEDTGEMPVGGQARPAPSDDVSGRQRAEGVLGLDDIVGQCPEAGEHRMLQRSFASGTGARPPQLPFPIVAQFPYAWASEQIIEVEKRRASGKLMGTSNLGAVAYYFDAPGAAENLVQTLASNLGIDFSRDGGFTSAVYRTEPVEETAWHAVVWLTAGSRHMVALSQTASGDLEFLCGESNVQGLLSAIRSNIESMGDLAAP